MKGRLERFLSSGEKGIFLYTGRKYKNNRENLLFTNPIKEIYCGSPARIESKIRLVERYIKKGYYAAGYISYEAGYFLEKKLKTKARTCGQLLYFGIFRKPYKITGALPETGSRFYRVSCLKNSITPAQYLKNFRDVKKNIKNGEVYQINYCFKKKFGFEGSAPELFNMLARRQCVSYAAYINDGKNTIISLSPELFFRVNNRNIEMKPMKGTVIKTEYSKGKKTKNSEKELFSEKNRAENLMIVDLIRNDLGKICETGSVRVTNLFESEEYETLYQMTSVIKGKLRKGSGFSGIIRAIFPSGSVTGAPKIRAMEIIRQIESEPRGVYTGAIGYASSKRAVFNIPIRTVEISGKNGKMGIGSGIISDSQPDLEYEEAQGKAVFFESVPVNFGLIESLLLRNGTYYLKSFHLNRMKKSAEFFGIRFSRAELIKGLERIRMKQPLGRFKVRAVLETGGGMIFSAEKISPKKDFNRLSRVCVWPGRVNSNDIMLRHKTTRRKFYDTALLRAKSRGYDDVIFLNRDGRVTEATGSNVFVCPGPRKSSCRAEKSVFITPPVSEGLLPGTFREHLIRSGRCRQGILTLRDLEGEAGVFLGNSVRGLVRAEVSHESKKNDVKARKNLT